MVTPDTSAPLTSPVFRAALSLNRAEREELAGWIALLRREIERTEEAWNDSAKLHLGTALLSTLHAIRGVCSGLRHELLGEATGAVAPYFPRIADARSAAAEFPAVIAFRDFTNGPPLATSTGGLVRQARDTAALGERIIGGGEFWRRPGN